jgi:penicillin V acylase-like amidase (Ntn superfamily)
MKKYFFVFTLTLLFTLNVFPCSRAMWVGSDGHVLVGRTMDWFQKMSEDIWVLPAGIERDGLAGENSLKWTSKYGSVVNSAYNITSDDGINEKGLVVNFLWLEDSDYGIRDVKRPGVSLSILLQFFIDNFATVDEAVKYLDKENIQIIPTMFRNIKAEGHISLGDPTGDNAIIEFIEGKTVIHHNKEYRVMTNEPSFDKQLTLCSIYQGFGGNTPLPGTGNPIDRFVRASYYIAHLPDAKTEKEAVAGVFSVMRNVSAPFSAGTPEKPNISATIWRSVSDCTNKIYFYESTISPNIIWVDLNNIDFSKGANIMKLDLINCPDIIGDATNKFIVSEPFKFLVPTNN